MISESASYTVSKLIYTTACVVNRQENGRLLITCYEDRKKERAREGAKENEHDGCIKPSVELNDGAMQFGGEGSRMVTVEQFLEESFQNLCMNHAKE